MNAENTPKIAGKLPHRNAPMGTPRAPEGLPAGIKRLWKAVVEQFALEEHHLRLLGLACEQLARAEAAKAALRDAPLIVQDRFKQDRPNPLIEIERSASLAAARLLRELGLDSTDAVEATRGYARRGG